MILNRMNVLLRMLPALLIIGGCSSTNEVRTSPPQPAQQVPEEAAAAEGRATLTVSLGSGETALPTDIHALRFRITEVQLKEMGGEWISFPADLNNIEIVTNGPLVRRPILSMQVRPAVYDSVAVRFGSTFVVFDENAGGPLTMPRDMPVRVPVTLDAQAGRSARLLLTFEPGASLSRDASCRWHFIPFITQTAPGEDGTARNP